MKKKIFAPLLAILFVSLCASSCKETDNDGENKFSSPQLAASTDASQYLFGEKVTYKVTNTEEGKAAPATTDIPIRLAFRGTAAMKDGSSKSIGGNEVFDDFQANFTLKKGEKETQQSYRIKQNPDFEKVSGNFAMTAEGKEDNTALQRIVIVRKFSIKVTIPGQKDLQNVRLNENDKFKIQLSIPQPAKEDIPVYLKPDHPDRMKDFPIFMTIKQGATTETSGDITILPDRRDSAQETHIMISATSRNEHYLINGDNLRLIVSGKEQPLGDALTDERRVYQHPDEVFVSPQNMQAAKQALGSSFAYKEMTKGMPHPNSKLAAEGWKFCNAMEFSPISALTNGQKANEYGNRTPRFTAEQSVKLTQLEQAVRNDKYTNMNAKGYLDVWSAYDPGLQTTGGYKGHSRNYGSAAIYMNKFDGNPNGRDKALSSQVRILPGTRVEARIRLKGKLRLFNPAVWFQGNTDHQWKWSYYGEADLLEAPQWASNTGDHYSGPWQTFHWNNVNKSGDLYKPTTKEQPVDLSKFQIFWFEWIDNETLAMGVNGKETLRIRKEDYKADHNGQWPFEDSFNPEGLHMLITLVCDNGWAAGNKNDSKDGPNSPDFDKYLKQIPYATSKTNPDTPTLEIDWIRFYTNSSYKYKGKDRTEKTYIPMY